MKFYRNRYHKKPKDCLFQKSQIKFFLFIHLIRRKVYVQKLKFKKKNWLQSLSLSL